MSSTSVDPPLKRPPIIPLSPALEQDVWRMNPWWKDELLDIPPLRRHLVVEIHRKLDIRLAPIAVVRGQIVMSTDPPDLVGGYLAGTLTDDEQRRLLEAALTDQALFDELTAAEPLRQLLAEPALRRQLHASAVERPGIRERIAAWLRPPARWALAGGLAAGTTVELSGTIRVGALRLQSGNRFSAAPHPGPLPGPRSSRAEMPRPGRGDRRRRGEGSGYGARCCGGPIFEIGQDCERAYVEL